MSHEQLKEHTGPERKVVIEVLGGVAYVASCPPDVKVEIIDHDNLEEEQDALDDWLERKDMPQEDDNNVNETE